MKVFKVISFVLPVLCMIGCGVLGAGFEAGIKAPDGSSVPGVSPSGVPSDMFLPFLLAYLGGRFVSSLGAKVGPLLLGIVKSKFSKDE